MTEKKVTIKQKTTFCICVDGVEVRGDWVLEDDWNGLIKLKCDAPSMYLIVRKPCISHINSFDLLHPIFGGNVKAWKEGSPEVEVTVVTNGHVNELVDKSK